MKTKLTILKNLLLIAGLSLFSSHAYAQQAQNASYPFDPATVALPEGEKGLLIEREFNNSSIYPGTTRKIQIYIPNTYDGVKPACLLVSLDGPVYYGMTNVMDNLIKTGEMPVTIGVFVGVGVFVTVGVFVGIGIFVTIDIPVGVIVSRGISVTFSAGVG